MHTRQYIFGQTTSRGFARVAVALALLMLAGMKLISAGEAPAASEYQVKAAFIVNFPKYADWPADAFATTNSPIVIAVAGETKVADELQKAIGDRTINGRKIVLRRLASGEETGFCHILFVSAADRQRSPNRLARLKDAAVLTVGEGDDFLKGGGVINLARRDKKIAMEVNLAAAGNAQIKISSKLLSLADVVTGKPE